MQRSLLPLFITALATLLLATTARAVPIVTFDFENATPGTSVVAASATAPMISGAEFGGSHPGSAVLDTSSGGGSNVYRSNSLLPTHNGGYYNYLSFTTSQALTLGSLAFTAEQNDCFPCTSGGLVQQGPHNFDVLLSPMDTATPSGLRSPALAGYSLLATIAVPYGFALGSPNFDIDLSGVTLGAGTFHFAFAASSPSTIITGTAQLFMDNITITSAPITSVPEPSSLMLLGAGLAAFSVIRRRKRAA